MTDIRLRSSGLMKEFQVTGEVQHRTRLDSLFRGMKGEVREHYDTILEEQLEIGMIEEVPAKPTGKRIFLCLIRLL